MLETAVANGRTALAGGDPELLETMRQLAGLHAAAGDPQGARRVLEEAPGRLSDGDPLAVMLAYDLAVVAEDLANRHVARTNYAKVAEFGPAAFGDDHWTVERARTYLATGPAGNESAPSTSAPPVSPARLMSGPPAYEPVTPAPVFAPTPPARPRRAWLPAALGGVAGGAIVAVVVAVLLTRPDAPVETTAAVQPIAPTSSAAAVTTPASQAPPPTTSPAKAEPSTVRPTTVKPTTVEPSPLKPTPAKPAARTRIVAPKAGTSVPYPFDTRFTVAPSDVSAKDTVVALLICVAGRCYLDGKLDIIGDGAAPYTIYLGSTRPEGAGVACKLRLDRLPARTYTTLVAARDKAIADGSWGDKGTPMSALNPTPLSTLTVTKAP